jgi:hypothetical protein
MTVNRTTLLDLPLPVTGTESGTWGDTTNNGLTQYMDIAIAGMSNLTSADFTAGALTIETTEGDSSATNISATSAQYAGFRVSSLAVNSTITVGNTGTSPARSYRLINADATYNLTFKATGQTGVTLLPGQSAVVAFNGTDYVIVGVVGAGSTTDNTVPRFDGTTGEILQSSGVTIDDSNNVSGVAQLNITTLDATNIEVTNIKAKDGTAAASIADSTGVVSITANPVLSGGTANGVLYLDGSKVATSGSGLVFDSSGNLGLGVTPSAWDINYRALQVGSKAALAQGSSDTYLGNNWINDGTNKYIATAAASLYGQVAGAHAWLIAPSGTAGNAITFTQAMTLDASGNLGVGTTSPSVASGLGIVVNGGAGQARIALKNTNSGDTAGDGFQLAIDTSSNAYIDQRENAALIFNTNNNERARITSGGDLGVGTTSPRSKLDVVGGDLYFGASGAGTSLYIGSNATSTGGQIYVDGTFFYLKGIASTTMVFFTGNTERARIDSSGNLLVGTTTSQDPLTVNGGITISGAGLDFSTSGTKNWQVVGNATDFYIGDQTLTRYAALAGITTFTAWTFVSDRRLKHEIKDLSYGLNALMQIKPREFNFIKDNQFSIGFIAQELKEVIPEAVMGNEIDFDDNDSPEERASKTMGVSKEMLIPVLVKAIQEQQALIQSLTARVATLEGTQP